VLVTVFAGDAAATVITPSTTADDLTNNGNCTLREAVKAADTDTAVDACPAGSGADVISLQAGTYTLAHNKGRKHTIGFTIVASRA
jgi:CSLREA domain-containing protein